MVEKPDSPDTDSSLLFEPLETPHSQRVESTYLIDLRRHRRFDIDLKAEARAERSGRLRVSITNISRSGLRLEASRQTVGALFSTRKLEIANTLAPLQVSFSLTRTGDRFVAVKVQCRPVYTRCDQENTCQVGMEFVTFDEGHDALMEYLARREATE